MNFIAGRAREATGLFACLKDNLVEEMADPMWMRHIRSLFSAGNSAEMLRIAQELQLTHTDPVMLDQAEHFLHYGTLSDTADMRLGLLHWERDTDEEWGDFIRIADLEWGEFIAGVKLIDSLTNYISGLPLKQLSVIHTYR